MNTSNKCILVVLSSARHLTVHPDAARKRTHRHETGYFLSELAVPAMALQEAGYTLVYASPSGDAADSRPDPISLSPQWFSSEAEYHLAAAQFTTLDLVRIDAVDIERFGGVFVPGGHAPMEDLPHYEALGILLRKAARKELPIGAICHGPAALLSAGIFFKDCRVTCFSRAEERQEEPGADNVLGGYVATYLDVKLEECGMEVSTRLPWRPYVVTDKGLVTGQNPMSDRRFAEAFLASLKARR